MTDRTSIAATASWLRSEVGSADEVPALVVAWSIAEPWRTGEVALVPPGGGDSVLGRGDHPGSGEDLLRFHRQRPSVLEATPPLSAPGLSRRQLVVRSDGTGIRLVRVGRCPLLVNGEPTDTATVREGDTVTLARQMVLLCVRRPCPTLAALHHLPAGDAPPFGEPDAHGVVGESPAVWALRDRLAFAATLDVHALILGESGTGKELAATAIHGRSRRRRGPLVSRSAATLPPGLIDAELFGNIRNYPNPGTPERPGLIGEASGGTLFLDEVGELPHELQAHLLRVLDSRGEYQRLGETRLRTSDLRLVCATNRGPETLKHDFLARLAFQVRTPSLAERPSDVPLLVRGLLRRMASRTPELTARFFDQAPGRPPEPRLHPTLMEQLLRRQYPSNVRQLEQVLWHAIAASTRGFIAPLTDVAEPPGQPPDDAPVRPSDLDADAINAALERCEGSVTRAARELGLPSRYSLYRLMGRLGLRPGAADPDP